MMRLLAVLAAIFLLEACKHPLAIVGEGDIIERLIGHRGCTLEEYQADGARCTDNEVSGDEYIVSYEAIPRPGWRFLRWAGTGCASESTPPYCEYKITRGWVNLIDETEQEPEYAATVAVFVAHPMTELLVGATANGSFGPLLGGTASDAMDKEMVLAAVLASGESLIIEASGQINIATNSPEGVYTGPDGTDFAGDTRPSPFYYFPLEEAAVDAGELSVPVSEDVELANIGALIGAFIPADRVRIKKFAASNDDPDPDSENFGDQLPQQVTAGSIAAGNLFLVGGGPYRFEAQEDGMVFLGVNDAGVDNNSGAYTVSISVE